MVQKDAALIVGASLQIGADGRGCAGGAIADEDAAVIDEIDSANGIEGSGIGHDCAVVQEHAAAGDNAAVPQITAGADFQRAGRRGCAAIGQRCAGIIQPATIEQISPSPNAACAGVAGMEFDCARLAALLNVGQPSRDDQGATVAGMQIGILGIDVFDAAAAKADKAGVRNDAEIAQMGSLTDGIRGGTVATEKPEVFPFLTCETGPCSCRQLSIPPSPIPR